MRLTESDKAYFLRVGHTEKDLRQLEEACNVTTYEYVGRKICRREAIELLGKETWLSGISRSAFHWSACRKTLDGEQYVLFDSSQLFKEV